MGMLDNITKIGWGPGLAIGLASVVLAPVVIPLVGGLVKPVIKGAIKGGIVLYNKSRTAAAETYETLEDLAAEARAELSQTSE